MAVLNRIPLLLPDKILVDTVNQLIQIVRQDYRDCVSEGREDECLLWILLKDQSIGREDLYKAAVKIFVTTPQSQRHFDCKLSFDRDTANSPQLFITNPSESERNNSIGIGEGDQDELIMPRNGEQDQYRAQYMRRYSSTYALMIVCENRNEMFIIYNVMKMLLVACYNNFALLGLSNMKLGGQELNLRDQIPDRTDFKSISISFEYEQIVPSLVVKDIFRKIKIFWELNDQTTPSGPIEVSTDDDLIASSSS